jgi:hypothetical protein
MLHEPRKDLKAPPPPRPEKKPRRFLLIKLEERIAPGSNNTHSCYKCGGGHHTGSTL